MIKLFFTQLFANRKVAFWLVLIVHALLQSSTQLTRRSAAGRNQLWNVLPAVHDVGGCGDRLWRRFVRPGACLARFAAARPTSAPLDALQDSASPQTFYYNRVVGSNGDSVTYQYLSEQSVALFPVRARSPLLIHASRLRMPSDL